MHALLMIHMSSQYITQKLTTKSTSSSYQMLIMTRVLITYQKYLQFKDIHTSAIIQASISQHHSKEKN